MTRFIEDPPDCFLDAIYHHNSSSLISTPLFQLTWSKIERRKFQPFNSLPCVCDHDFLSWFIKRLYQVSKLFLYQLNIGKTNSSMSLMLIQIGFYVKHYSMGSFYCHLDGIVTPCVNHLQVCEQLLQHHARSPMKKLQENVEYVPICVQVDIHPTVLEQTWTVRSSEGQPPRFCLHKGFSLVQ